MMYWVLVVGSIWVSIKRPLVIAIAEASTSLRGPMR